MNIVELVNALRSCRRCGANVVERSFVVYGVYERWFPSTVRTLIVSESPPPGTKQDFLYNLGHRDRLRKTLARFWNLSENEVLDYLRRNHAFWTMAIKCRPRDRTCIKTIARNCLEILRLEIEIAKPKRIVALGTTASESVKIIAPRTEIVFERHPLYVVRFERNRAEQYFQRLKELISIT